MAEEKELTSIIDSSDLEFEITCTPCGEDSIREEAVKYCTECQEYLCVTCTRHHSRLKATRSHKLVNINDVKIAGSLVVRTSKCRYHSDRDIEMYCVTHDMVYCTKCIATEHRSSCEVVNIEDVPKSKIQSKDLQELHHERLTIGANLKSAGERINTGIRALEEQKVEILQRLQEMERDLTKHIWKLKGEATEVLKKNYGEAKHDLESDYKVVTHLLSEIEDPKRQLQNSDNSELGQQFVQIKLLQQLVQEAKKFSECSSLKKVKTLTFTENTELRNSVMAVSSLGQIGVQAEYRGKTAIKLYKIKGKTDINVEIQNDSAKCMIVDTCQLQDGTVVLADWSNCKLKRLDKNVTIKDHCDLESSPLGVCCSGHNEVAVKMKGKIQFIYVGIVFSKLRDIAVEASENFGIVSCGGDLWVSSGSGVNIYSTTGKRLKSIVTDVNGRELFKGATQHMAVSDDSVIVTDSCDGAVCLRKDGTLGKEFRDQRLNNTKGVCVSSDGTVFLTGHDSGNISVFSSDGYCLGNLLGDLGVPHPLSLSYNQANCIYVTCGEYSKFIHILEITD